MLALGPAGCGEDEPASARDDDYCTLLRHFDERIDDTDWRHDPERISGVVDDLVRESPSQVRRSWQKYGGAFRVSLRFLGKHLVDADDPPSGMTMNDAKVRNRRTFNRAIRPVTRARPHASRISRHATRECGFEPGL